MNNAAPPEGHVKGYLPTLDGWRAIAIGMVLLNHDKIYSLGRFSTAWFRINGNRGVAIFFALSGLLICTRLLQEERIRGKIDLRGFYIRRVCRIQPAALTYLAVLAVLMGLNILAREPAEMLSSVLLVRNIFPLHSPPGSWYTGHFWSLSVEEHFYLLLPAFLLLVRKHRAWLLIMLVLVLEVWRQLVYRSPSLQFGRLINIRTDLAISGILLGAIAAILLDRKEVRHFLVHFAQPWLVLTLAALCWIWVEFHPILVLSYLPFLCIYPLVIMSTMLHPNSLSGRFLELPLFRFIGKISYSIYLWQMLFLTYNKAIPTPNSAALQLIQATPLRYIAVLVVSILSYYVIEKPMMRLGHRLARPATRGRGDLEETPSLAGVGRPVHLAEPT